jgi:hypothetical protein
MTNYVNDTSKTPIFFFSVVNYSTNPYKTED